MNIPVFYIILAINTLIKADSVVSGPEDEFCSSQTADYIFNFINQEFYANGILIKTSDGSIIFNDDLFETSFTNGTKELQNNNYTAGCAIRAVQKCHPRDSPLCEFNEKAIGLQILADNFSNIYFERNGKPIDKAKLPLPSSANHQTDLVPQLWFTDPGVCAYVSTRQELVFVPKKNRNLFWSSQLSDTTVFTRAVLPLPIEITVLSMFEVNANVYLLAKHDKQESYPIYKYSIDPKDSNKRIFELMSDLTLQSVFNCKIESSKSFDWQQFLIICMNLVMVLLVLCFLVFLVYQVYLEIGPKSHQKIF